MGLAERRATKEFETKRFPQFKNEIAQAAAFEVPIEVKWDQLALEGKESLYEECWPDIYFKPLINALKAIAIDDMGREALGGALKSIVIENRSGNWSGSQIASFVDGVLTLDHDPITNSQNVEERTDSIRTALESKL